METQLFAASSSIDDHAPRRRIVILGRPGAGKGTQGAVLARRLGVRHLSSGDLLRHEIEARSPLGEAVERLVTAGRLVPTGLMLSIVESHLDEHGYVLDGYPRTLIQAEGLLGHCALRPDLAIHLDVPDTVVFERLARRRRHDDATDITRTRLQAYERETLPAVALLEQAGIMLRVDGTDTPTAVANDIWTAVLRGLRPNAALVPEIDLTSTADTPQPERQSHPAAQ